MSHIHPLVFCLYSQVASADFIFFPSTEPIKIKLNNGCALQLLHSKWCLWSCASFSFCFLLLRWLVIDLAGAKTLFSCEQLSSSTVKPASVWDQPFSGRLNVGYFNVSSPLASVVLTFTRTFLLNLTMITSFELDLHRSIAPQQGTVTT